MKIATIGLDVAKNVFQVHGADAEGRAVLRKRLRRNQVTEFFANLPPCLVGLEACCGSHYWFRVLSRTGHTVRLIAPQFVKPYVKSNKNDANDAEAICEAVSRPQMRFVPAKSIEQQDIQSLHRVRSRLVSSRTRLASQVRGLLAEYGIVLPRFISQLRRGLPLILEDAENELTDFSRRLFASLYEELVQLDDKIKALDEQVQAIYRASETCQRVAAVEGIGPLIATALVAAISDGKSFTNGRQFAAWLGLVPRQHSTGGKARLFGISKRGDPYLRTLLIHGARSVVYRASRKTDTRNRWIADKQRRLGTSKACVALANKNARIVWSLIARGESYRRAA
ncbi:MAG TPA: IS110 family transposase [Candidatus Acidoferrales bacterium]|nr:IS110 family transposase [Candidatus Acidoferrales bacterium]